MKTGIKVFDAMTNKPVAVQHDLSISECAVVMKKYGVGSLLIKESEEVIGILTEKDLVIKVLALRLDPGQTLASDIMERNLFTISPEQDIYDAIMEMKINEVRRLPVAKKGKIVGLVTLKDVLRIEPQLFDLMIEHMDLRELDSKPVIKQEPFKEGVCESCSNWSYKLNESSICSECH